ncbi:MAG: DegV family protein [Coriobacteriia bacterium]|nr:DegV family protein [Coriobacteriia bacterium]
MSNSTYDIITDSTANLPDDLLKAWNIRVLPLEFIVDDISYKGYDPDVPTDNKQFYDMMRAGKEITTTLASKSDADRIIRDCFDKGQDAIYIGFDSALSANFEEISAYMEQIRVEFYPTRQLRCVDTLAAALGEGLIVADAYKQREMGLSLSELADWVEANRLDYACWFTVEDLKYLQRGGRLTAGAAFAGMLLSIQPVLHIDAAGMLIPREKLRGRKRAIQYLADKVVNTIQQPFEGQSVFLSHADSPLDIESVKSLIAEKCPGIEFLVNNLDPVIGAHTGPGTLCVFFKSHEGRG